VTPEGLMAIETILVGKFRNQAHRRPSVMQAIAKAVTY